MAKNFWNLVNRVIREADVLIEVLDARMITETRNVEVELKIQKAGKRLVFVINKCDLVDKDVLDDKKKQLPGDCVFVSTHKHFGMTLLLKLLLSYSRGEDIKVGILGYPNTGKSSVINALKGRKSAATSSVSGYTKALQFVRIHRNLLMLDTPGVFPYGEDNEIRHALIAAKNPAQLKNPDIAAMKIIEIFKENNKRAYEEFYGVKITDDVYETLEQTAIAKKRLMKGGDPDIDAMARVIVSDWQKGKLRLT